MGGFPLPFVASTPRRRPLLILGITVGSFGLRRWDFDGPLNVTGSNVIELQLSDDQVTWKSPTTFSSNGPTWIILGYGIIGAPAGFFRIIQRPVGIGSVDEPIEVIQEGVSSPP